LALGSQRTFVAEESGLLLLFVNDTDLGNNSGGFNVLVTVDPAR
jgi:hypothetical protein